MSIRRTFIGLVLIILPSAAFADTFIIGTPGEVAAGEFGANVGNAINALRQARQAKQDANAAIVDARDHYFDEYPNGPDFAQAEQRFAELLWEKDLFYLLNEIETEAAGSGARERSAFFETITGGGLDGGIPASVKYAFDRWVGDVIGNLTHGRDLNVLTLLNQEGFVAAVKESQDSYQAYRTLRDEAEFARWCGANPMSYCSYTGKVASPKFTKSGDMTIIQYGRVPDDYEVQMPAVKNGPVLYDIRVKRYRARLLREVQLHNLRSMDAGPRERQLNPSTPEGKIFWDDVKAIQKEGGIALICDYVSADKDTRYEAAYWYKSIPPAANPTRLAQRDQRHPLLRFRGAASSCPVFYPDREDSSSPASAFTSSGPYGSFNFGAVANDFEPPLPKSDDITKALTTGGKNAIWIKMIKSGPGTLSEITYKAFQFSDVDPYSKCFELDHPDDPISRRICSDFEDMKTFYKDAYLLICNYTDQRPENVPSFIYWFAKRPPLADPANLLKRSHQHPMLRIGDPRTECPSSMKEAQASMTKHQRMITELSGRVAEIPANVVIPRPAWQQKALEAQQAKRQSEYERHQQVEAALETFPIEGEYKLDMTANGTMQSGICTVVQEMDIIQYSIVCHSGTSLQSTEGEKSGGTFMVSVGKFDTMIYTVDLDYREQHHGEALIGKMFEKPGNGHLMRTGDLIPMSSFPLEGAYDLRVTLDGATLNNHCTIAKEPRVEPPRYHALCNGPDGVADKLMLQTPNTKNAAGLWVNDWGPKRIQINGKYPQDFYFIVDAEAQKEGRSELIGYSSNDFSARLTRKGDANDAGGHLVSQPKVNPSPAAQFSSVIPSVGNATSTSAESANNQEQIRIEMEKRLLEAKKRRLEERAAVTGSQLDRTHPTVAAAGPAELTGEWTGSYVCAQGKTALKLTLKGVGRNGVWGIFAFSATPENPDVPSGKFYVYGKYIPNMNQIALNPWKWIVRPQNYSGVSMTGHLSEQDLGGANALRRISGSITYPLGCKQFDVTHTSDSTAALGEEPEFFRRHLR